MWLRGAHHPDQGHHLIPILARGHAVDAEVCGSKGNIEHHEMDRPRVQFAQILCFETVNRRQHLIPRLDERHDAVRQKISILIDHEDHGFQEGSGCGWSALSYFFASCRWS